MSKKFNVQEIVVERKNELDNSPLFQSKKAPSELKDESISIRPRKENLDSQQPSPPIQEEQLISITDRPTGRPPDEAANRPGDRPKGLLVRRGFEWYADQLSALKKLSLKDQLEGKPGSMSQMVRDALDDYLEKRATEK